jgi:hypothetical protein
MLFKENELSARSREVMEALESMHQSEIQAMAQAASDDDDLIERIKGSILAHTKCVAIQLGLLARACDVSVEKQIKTAFEVGKFVASKSMLARTLAEVADLTGDAEPKPQGGELNDGQAH